MDTDKDEFSKNIETGENVDIWVDIEKAQEDKSGRRFIYGRASDESLDLDNEITKSSGLAKSLEYFKKFGKINYDHKSKKDPKYLIGEPVEAEVKNGEFFVKGELYKGVECAESIWKLLKANAKMGFSIQGKVLATEMQFSKALGKDVKTNTRVIVTDVAVTPHPKNMNTFCQPWGEFAKSLGASEDTLEDLTEDEIRDVITKSLDTSEGSGKPMIGESLEKKIHVKTFGAKDKKKEDEENEEDSEKNKKKKKLSKGEEIAMVDELKKAVAGLNTGVEDLVKAIQRNDDAEIEAEEKLSKSKVAAEEKEDEASSKKDEEESSKKDEDEDEEDAEKKKKKAKKDKKEDEEEECSGKKEDEEESSKSIEDEAISEKEMKKAFEVTPVLQHIGKAMEESNDLTKSLIMANTRMTDVIKDQGELIKSLSDRLDEIEDQPLPHKSVSRAIGKHAAGEDQTNELNKSVEDKGTIEDQMKLVQTGKLNKFDIVKNELNIQ